jgi:hypothetical protein
MMTDLDEAHTARVTAEQQSEVSCLLYDMTTANLCIYLLCWLEVTGKAPH